MTKTVYNDNYKTPSVGEWELLEFDHHILNNRREELGLTQEQVAEKAHIKLEQYQYYENGKRSMATANMRIGLSICRVLELDPYRFVSISKR